MSFSESFRSGAHYLRGVANRVVGTFEQAAAPQQVDHFADREDVISFFTGDNRDPFNVKFKLFKLSDSWGKNAHRICIETNNARHPYDKKFQFGYFGKEIMNPALLTALDKIEQVLNRTVADQIGDLNIQKATNECREGKFPQVNNNMDGVELWMTLNTNDCSKEAKHEDIVRLYQSLVASVKDNAPVIQSHIDQSTILQPLPKPSAETLLAFDNEISDIIMRVVSKVSELPASTQFVLPDGTKRGLIKGLEP